MIFRTGLFRLLLGRRAVIVAFHRVDDRLKGNPLACTLAEFDAYCAFFRRYFRVVTLSELLDRLRRGESVARLLAITFDDGYLDNHRVAAPVLRRHRLPACFFVSTGLIGSETRTWWDAEFGAASEWMGWDEVRSLRVQGFEIGVHTVHHVDLGVARGGEALREIVGAQLALRGQGIDTALFSYPYGRETQITEAAREIVQASGLACCLSAHGGLVRPGDDPYRLRRAPIHPWLASPFHFGFEILTRP